MYHINKGYGCIKPVQNYHNLKIFYSLARIFIYTYFLYTKNFHQATLQHIIPAMAQNYWVLFHIPVWP